MSSYNRSLYLRYADAIRHPGNFSTAISEFFAKDANISVVHPFKKVLIFFLVIAGIALFIWAHSSGDYNSYL